MTLSRKKCFYRTFGSQSLDFISKREGLFSIYKPLISLLKEAFQRYPSENRNISATERKVPIFFLAQKARSTGAKMLFAAPCAYKVLNADQGKEVEAYTAHCFSRAGYKINAIPFWLMGMML
ncbi:hypothetical protein BDI_0577 [Parabacteroides distasonis ATCC 8503]|uniref:Uncharacterized protein n=1 Tax=Parabacteroides distasonis (strain ATCC 8503 / DSM 20701 / CIP 104284 / JCM 5825 / NCTC 11152) TaxID=435591 RepID=A6L9I9_PARD8|nr:hypothetical protein BDI_0577 [Parabacteroides distasonis ATCC 8503]